MNAAKIAISLDRKLLADLDGLVKQEIFPNRSKAVEAAVREKFSRLNHKRLARECSKLNPLFEQALADEGLSDDLTTWPPF